MSIGFQNTVKEIIGKLEERLALAEARLAQLEKPKVTAVELDK